MSTNQESEKQLLTEAMKLTGIKSKREAIRAGLESLIRLERLKGLDEPIGQVDYYDDAPALAGLTDAKRKPT